MSVMTGGSKTATRSIIGSQWYWKGGTCMIEVTRLNDKKLLINAELIEKVEESPDTVITLTSGNKVIVKESRQEIKNLVILYKKEIFGRDL